MQRKKIILSVCAGALLLGAGIFAWSRTAAPTKVAFVNYQAITLGQIAKANSGNSWVKIAELAPEELGRAADYDMVLVNGMGLRVTEEQRQALIEAAQGGTPVLTTAATNPQNLIVSVDSVDQSFLSQYLAGGRSNYRNLMSYIRRFIDGKKLFAPVPGDPVTSSSSLIYYPGGAEDGDDLGFNSVADYEAWLKKHGKLGESTKKVILTGQMGVADSLVASLERRGMAVYPVTVIQRFIAEGRADSVGASAMINMAHGRMGDNVVELLSEKNIPLFSPLNVNRPYDEWMADKMGMNGGFLSQSVVTPEIDGAVLPYALFAHFEGEDGLPEVAAIPDRLERFTETVANYVALQTKPNAEKRVAVFYFKGPGQSALVAEGMEVAPALFNFLKSLKEAGYRVDNLPSDAASLEKLINANGRIFNDYAVGAKADFAAKAHPRIINKEEYDTWRSASLSDAMKAATDSVDGPFPGHAITDGQGNLALPCLLFGNVALLPQPAAGLGDDDFQIVHGTDAAPPHQYVAAYLWAKHGFGADALAHFGAHGSLEFTPRKQVALGSEDWSDRLVGTLPHIYLYSTSNVGEAMIAKRRSYAGIVNYLTPPFLESDVRGIYKNLSDAIAAYNDSKTHADSVRGAELVKKHTLELGIHRELRIDSVKPFTSDDVLRVETFAEELANEKITGALYVLGTPYSSEHIASTVEAMTIDPIAYSLQKLRGGDLRQHRAKAKKLVNSGAEIDDAALRSIAGLTQAEIDSARAINTAIEGSKGMFSRMMVMGAMMNRPQAATSKIADRPETAKSHSSMMAAAGMDPEKAIAMAKKMGASDEAIKKMRAAIEAKKNVVKGGHPGASAGHPGGKMMGGMGAPRREFTKEEIEFAQAVGEVERALANIGKYRRALSESPSSEIASLLNALNGGYIAPTSGGDPVLNPEILPTGRNMYAVNAEETPSAVAWEKGKDLADNTIAMYRKAHGDSVPRKVSYTLWSSEFIETEGATIAQVLYMLGVEPVRDPFGRVTDLRLIPSEELGRPRIDVVVQTSGQLRDLAASRLFLIGRAVKMAAEADDKAYPNYVREGVVESERVLVDKGVSPKEARSLSTQRVFGGVNGNYGSGIQSMVEAGDRWEDASEIADTYINNMGASYGSEEDWEQARQHAFEAALTRTDVVVQPRQSNTWGALSLDHVYEFMGGMNLAVRNVTGKEPEAYLSDYRNRNRARMQEVKEAIGVESRTTVLNPAYLKEKMKGGAGDASAIADIVRNTYGWNVMKPEAIDNELWDGIYASLVEDVNGLGTKKFFTDKSPAAIQEITAVMLETSRKGMWKATPEQLAKLAELHTEVVAEYGAACTGFVCDNAKLRDYIASQAPASAAAYNAAVAQARAENISSGNEGTVMKREELNSTQTQTNRLSAVAVAAAVVIALGVIFLVIRRRRKEASND